MIKNSNLRRSGYMILGSAMGALLLTYGLYSFIAATRRIYNKDFPSFLVYSNRMVSVTKKENWEGIKRNLSPFDLIIEINGKPVREGRDVYDEARNTSLLHIKVKRKDEVLNFTIPTSRFSTRDYTVFVLIPFIGGMIFFILGAVVYFVKRFEKTSLLFFLLSSLISLFYFSHINSNFVHILPRFMLLYPMFGAVGIQFFGIFPLESPFHAINKKIIQFVYGIFGTLTFMNILCYSSPKIFPYCFKISILLTGTAFLVIMGILSHRLAITRNSIVRGKIRVFLFTLLSASFTSAMWAITFPFTHLGITTDIQILLSLIFPILMTYAIFKYNVFDMDRLVRLGITFVFLSSVLTGVYFLAVAFIILFAQHIFKTSYSPTHIIMATLAVAVLFHPLRLGIKKLLTSTLYKEELKLRNALSSFSESLPLFYDSATLLRRIVALFEGELGFNRIAVYLRENSEESFTDRSSEFGVISHPLSREIEMLLNSPFFFQLTSPVVVTPYNPEDFHKKLHAEGIKVIIPLFTKEFTAGLILLGERFEGETYTGEDVNMFKNFAKTISLIFENSLIYTEMAKKERLAIIGEMASIIIHEIKNPLGIISVSLGTLSKIIKEKNEKIDELLSIITNEIERMNQTLKKILSYAKYTPPVFELKNPVEILNLTLEGIRPLTQGKQVELKINLQNPISPFLMDAEKMQTLFQNLLLNALESIENAGKIEIIMKEEIESPGKKEFVIEIKDSGKGIPHGLEKMIFKPFYSTKKGGTGLGLAVCERIVKDHAGRIECFNNEWGGATFIVTLPVRS